MAKASVLLAPLAVGLAVWSVAMEGGLLAPTLVVAWAVAATVVARFRKDERLGLLVLSGTFIGGVAAWAAAAIGHGTWVGLAQLALPVSIALLPAAAMHVLLGLPDGRCRLSRAAIGGGYLTGALIGVALWTQRPDLPLWPVAVEAVVAASIGLAGSNARYRRSEGVERRRLQWFGWAVAVGADVALVATALHLLAGWPARLGDAVVAATLPIPLALVLGALPGLIGRIDRLLAHTISLAGLSALIVAVYLVVVLGLGRAPTDEERSVLVLSMAAAAVAALLYLPARERLARFSNRFVYGEREAPEQVLRTFGSRLSRAIPLEELLYQVTDSLRKSLGLSVAELWTGSSGRYDRAVSVPDAPADTLTLSPSEEAVVARAGVSGPAWAAIWLPSLVRGRDDVPLRVVPIVHSGDLLGLIVAVRPASGELFGVDDDSVLAELARQVALALHNVQLDSALQASLDELRHQAGELRESRARIVAASDAARRQIERNLHDGAQQHLVALAVNLRLARQVIDADPATSKELLDQLSGDLQDAVTELRSLAHGIYPPLLADQGLTPALSAAAARAALPTEVDSNGIGRYSGEIEAAVYFCCLEALQNAAKHAGEGATATVRVREDAGGLLFEVADDGAGFDPAAVVGHGAGFVNMTDRVGAIGGSVSVESSPGAGTRVSGRIPIGGGAPRRP